VYEWGKNGGSARFGNTNAAVPTPVEALRGVHVGSVAAAGARSYAVANTGELWAWGEDIKYQIPLGHGQPMNCPLPKPIESLRGIKMDAVAANSHHTLALADDGSVYAWGDWNAAEWGSLSLGPVVVCGGRVIQAVRGRGMAGIRMMEVGVIGGRALHGGSLLGGALVGGALALIGGTGGVTPQILSAAQ
jgi:hypothetical protein